MVLKPLNKHAVVSLWQLQISICIDQYIVFSLVRQQAQFRYEIATRMRKNIPKASWEKFSLKLQMIIREMEHVSLNPNTIQHMHS